VKRMSIIGAAALVALTWGCAGLNVPGQGQGEGQQDAQQDDAAEPTMVAGTWTRRGDNPLRFAVTDDGTTVHGALEPGQTTSFTSYTFDLTRQGAKLTGKANFQHADFGATQYESKWEAKVEGTTITVKLDDLFIDETPPYAVSKRETIEHVYDVQPAAEAAPQEYTPPPMDMSAYVTPMANYKMLLAEGIAVGQWVEVETDAMGNKSKARTAVVGETADAWIIEIDNQMNQKDLLLAVFVDKTTGDCKKAYVGNRGKDGTEKTPPAATPPPTGEAQEPPREDITVGAGTFNAMRIEAGGTTTWVGASGDAQGVMLKMQGAVSDELTKLSTGPVEMSGTSFEAKICTYSSGNVYFFPIDPKPYLNAGGTTMLRMKMVTAAGTMDMRLVGQGTDAKPELNYPR
jgi:hypothetical protein